MAGPCRPLKHRVFAALSFAHFETLIQGCIEKITPLFSSPLRWTRSGQFHVTLDFFSAVSSEQVSEICEVLSRETFLGTPFLLGLRGLGFFPNKKKPLVIWLGLDGEVDKLVGFQASLRHGFEKKGFVFEKRGFSPHLTLARVPDSRIRVPERLPEFKTPMSLISEVILYESFLSTPGAHHEIIQRFPLSSVHA